MLFMFCILQAFSIFIPCGSKEITLNELSTLLLNESAQSIKDDESVQVFLAKELYPFADNYELEQPKSFIKQFSTGFEVTYTVFYSKKTENVKYVEILVSKIKPDLYDIIKKYSKNETDTKKISELALNEYNSIRYTENEKNDQIISLINYVEKKVGFKPIRNETKYIWSSNNYSVVITSAEDQISIVSFWK